MLPGWCWIAIAALELGNGDSWCHMCAFRFHFWDRKLNWNQASHVRASSELELGDCTQEEDLLRSCHHATRATASYATTGWKSSWCRLPPIFNQLWNLLAYDTPNRATGLDLVPSGLHHDQTPLIARFYYSLLLKIHIWCAEPLQFKGVSCASFTRKGVSRKPTTIEGFLYWHPLRNE